MIQVQVELPVWQVRWIEPWRLQSYFVKEAFGHQTEARLAFTELWTELHKAG